MPSLFRAMLVVSTALSATGWTRPQLPPTHAKPVAERGAQLDYIIVAVNGEARLVRAGQDLVVVRGDQLEVREGTLIDRSLAASELNLVGFQAPGLPLGDDRGVSVNTATDLRPRWSEGGDGQLYGILATSKSVLHGVVYLRVIEPALRYAELSINGKPVILRDGEAVEVGSEDMVKVKRVVTNLQSNTGVYFQIVPTNELRDEQHSTRLSDQNGNQPRVQTSEPIDGQVDDSKLYDIRFLRNEQVFATIPLKVKD